MFDLEKKHKAFIFAPSEHLPMSTTSMDPKENEQLYSLGMYDYVKLNKAFQAFIEDAR